jgi:hypothetical protein
VYIDPDPKAVELLLRLLPHRHRSLSTTRGSIMIMRMMTTSRSHHASAIDRLPDIAHLRSSVETREMSMSWRELEES